MLKMKLLILGLLMISASLKAQNNTNDNSKPQDLSPSNLLQVYKTWQMDVPNYYKLAYFQLRQIDNHWSLLIEPQKDNGLMLLFGYQLVPSDNASWYKNKEYTLMLAFDSTKNAKAVLYMFTDPQTLMRYRKQMELMKAVELGSRPYQAGKSTAYQINDISVLLIEFPPGINGTEATYEVQLAKI